ncbi:MAG: ECF transporter S component [Evtepia sp.]
MNTKIDKRKSEFTDVKFLTTTAVFLVLVYLFTAFINIRLPISINGGLIHLGNVPLFIAAILFGKKTGMIAGGLGMALFDVMSGWTMWAPFTLVIVGCMGYLVGAITEKHKTFPFYLLAMAVACVVKIGGYYIAECILYQNMIAPLTSIPGNLLQIALGSIVALAVIKPLEIAAHKTILRNAAGSHS